jgi:hypothetical protein
MDEVYTAFLKLELCHLLVFFCMGVCVCLFK